MLGFLSEFVSASCVLTSLAGSTPAFCSFKWVLVQYMYLPVEGADNSGVGAVYKDKSEARSTEWTVSNLSRFLPLSWSLFTPLRSAIRWPMQENFNTGAMGQRKKTNGGVFQRALDFTGDDLGVKRALVFRCKGHWGGISVGDVRTSKCIWARSQETLTFSKLVSGVFVCLFVFHLLASWSLWDMLHQISAHIFI